MPGFFKKAALAIGGVFAAGKVIDFGKMSVQAAATAQALDSQFKQVFKGLSPAAMKETDKLAKEFGMVSNRIKPSMAKMTSMFKGLGMDTKDAMGKASEAVRLSADAAAFYDVSYEDANGALTSFIKGNYEAGESIGLFANDTQLAAFAVKKGVVSSAKEWANLDEKTKQATRLDYAKNMQKQAGATGQAAREANGLENIMGNVKQAWQDFLAIVGKPILKAAIPIIKGATSGLSSLGDGAKAVGKWIGDLWEKFKETSAFKSITKGLDNIRDGFNTFKDTASTVWDYITNIFTNNDPLKNVKLGEKLLTMIPGDVIVAIQDKTVAIRDTFEKMKKGIEAVIGVITGKFNSLGDLKNAFGNIFNDQQLQVIKTVGDGIKTAIDKVKGAFSDAGKIVSDAFGPFIKEHGPAIKEALDNIMKLIQIGLIPIFVNVGLAIYNAFNTARAVIDNFKNLFGGIVTIIKGVLEVIIGVFALDGETIKQGFGNIWKGAVQLLKGIWGTIVDIIAGPIRDLWTVVGPVILNFVTNIKAKFSEAWNNIKQVTSDVWNGIKAKISDTVNGAKTAVSNAWTNIQTATSTIFNGTKAVALSVWNGIKTTISNAVNNVKSAVSNAWNNVRSVTSSIFNGVRSVASSIWNGIKSTVSNVVNGVRNAVSNAWNGVRSVTSSIFNGVSSTASSIWNSIRSTISNVVNGVRSTVSNVWNGIRSVTSSVFNGIRSTASAVWNGVRSAITSPISAARDTVSGIVNNISRIFNGMRLHFPSISIPHIPLPHFSISGSFNPLKGKMPSIGINWFAKGGILNDPTIFGMAGGKMLGGGEAGSEAVLPLNRDTLGNIGAGIAATMNSTGIVEQLIQQNQLTQQQNKMFNQLLIAVTDGVPAYVDLNAMAKKMWPLLEDEQDLSNSLYQRGRGFR